MVKQLTSERRNHVRAKRILSIQYRLKKGQRRNADHSWGLSTTQDMSLEGLSFYTDREFEKNDVLELLVIMSGVLKVYNGLGKIVRVGRKNSGACFLAAVKFVEKSHIHNKRKIPRYSVKKSQISKRV